MNCDDGRCACSSPWCWTTVYGVNRFGGLQRFSSRKGEGSTLWCWGNIKKNQTNPLVKRRVAENGKNHAAFLRSCSGLSQGHVVYQEIFTTRWKWRCPPFVWFPCDQKREQNWPMGPIHQSLPANEFAQGKKRTEALKLTKPWPSNTLGPSWRSPTTFPKGPSGGVFICLSAYPFGKVT